MKATFEEIWEKEYDALDSTCMDKFRKTGNVNQWLMKFWQLAAGNYTVRRDSFAYCYHVKEYNYPDLCRDIPSQKHNMICINDTAETTDFEVKKQGVIDAFENFCLKNQLLSCNFSLFNLHFAVSVKLPRHKPYTKGVI